MNKELKSKIEETNVLIEQYALLLMRDKEKLAGTVLSEITSLLLAVIPRIVSSYENILLEGMENKQNDMEYWVNQMGRITEVIQGRDSFAKIDVLYMETRENLILYVKMMDEMEI